VSLIPITFDGTALYSTDLTIVSRFTRGSPGEPPQVRGTDDTVPGRPGRVPYPRVADVLPIGLLVRIQPSPTLTTSQSLAAIETLRRSLLTLFTPGVPRVLSAALKDGATATINADVLPPVLVKDLIPDAPGFILEFDVALESVDPGWAVEPPLP